jgi:hypothetical protein
MWFSGDEWAMFITRRVNWGQWTPDALFRPHNEHWSTLPVIIFDVLYRIFGVRTYLPYLAIGAAIHVGVGVVSWSILRRIGISAWVAAGCATILLFFGAGAENIMWAFQVGFMGSVFLGLSHLRLAMHDGKLDRRDAIGVILGCLGLMASGVGLTMVGMVALDQTLRGRWRGVALHLLVPGALFVTWYACYGRLAVRAYPFTPQNIPDYVRAGLVLATDQVTQLSGTGASLAVLVIVGYASGWFGNLRRVGTPLAMATAVPLFFSISAVGRASLGVQQATSSRYVYIAGMLLMPTVAMALDRLRATNWPGGAIAVTLFISWSLVVNAGLLSEFSEVKREHNTALRAIVLAAAQVANEPGVNPKSQPEPRENPDITMGGLRLLASEGALPKSAASADELFAARATLLVRPGSASDGRSVDARSSIAVTGGRPGNIVDGCTEIAIDGASAQVVPAPTDPGDLRITSPRTATVQVERLSLDRTMQVPSLTAALEPNVPFDLLVRTPDVQLVIDITGTSTATVCGVGEVRT